MPPMRACERPRQRPGTARQRTIRARQETTQCAVNPVLSTTDVSRLRRSGALIWLRPGAGIDDLDETLTAVPPVLTPSMQQARVEVPSVVIKPPLIGDVSGQVSRPGWWPGRRWRRW